MLATLAPLALVIFAAQLPDAPPGDAGSVVAGLRQRPSALPPRRGVHELKDPGGWPAVPSNRS